MDGIWELGGIFVKWLQCRNQKGKEVCLTVKHCDFNENWKQQKW